MAFVGNASAITTLSVPTNLPIPLMRTLPQVTVVGDTTGGGSGNPVYRELPNGWTSRVPRWLEFTSDFEPFEGVGLAPDIWVSTPDALLESGTDRIFETAVEILRTK